MAENLNGSYKAVKVIANIMKKAHGRKFECMLLSCISCF